MKLLADASLPDLHKAFPAPFCLTLYKDLSEVSSLLADQDILLCRSTLKVNRQLLQGHNLEIIATASSGCDHIDAALLKEKGITLLDAKGSNAAAVADYVLSVTAWLQKEASFCGTTAGVIGAGAVGTQVMQRLQATGCAVIYHDPFIAADSRTLQEIQQCHLICVHANLHDNQHWPSRNLLNKEFFSQLRPNTAIINAARGGLVNQQELLACTTPLLYCTDVYANEPEIDNRIVDFATLCTPHIAGHSLQAKYRAVYDLSEKLHKMLQLQAPNLSIPAFTQPKPLAAMSWQDYVLSLYNPLTESQSLKKMPDKRQTFINLRKTHMRHEFDYDKLRPLFKNPDQV